MFLRHKTDHKADRPAYNAFMPASNKRRSVYRVDGLSSDAVQQLGKEYVEPKRGPLRGYGAQIAGAFYGQGLEFDPDGMPHERHANVIGWSNLDAKNRLIAENLARGATLHLFPKSESPTG